MLRLAFAFGGRSGSSSAHRTTVPGEAVALPSCVGSEMTSASGSWRITFEIDAPAASFSHRNSTGTHAFGTTGCLCDRLEPGRLIRPLESHTTQYAPPGLNKVFYCPRRTHVFQTPGIWKLCGVQVWEWHSFHYGNPMPTHLNSSFTLKTSNSSFTLGTPASSRKPPSLLCFHLNSAPGHVAAGCMLAFPISHIQDTRSVDFGPLGEQGAGHTAALTRHAMTNPRS